MDEAKRIPEIEPEKRGPSLFGSFIKMAVSGVLLLFVIGAGLLLKIPDVSQLERCFTTSMYKVYLCPGSENYVKLSDISPYMIHALIVAEDGSFYSHKGFDWHEIQESFSANLRSGEKRRGGSTLTQQLAKNVFLNQDKSLTRKLKEAYLANAIERHYSKDFILEKYLNVVEFGPKLYGVRAASRHYFGIEPRDLHPLQAAYLAHLLPNPKVYSRSFRQGTLTPFSNKMVSLILKRMRAYGKLSQNSYHQAMVLIGDFPWQLIGMDAFTETPSYSLEMDIPPPKAADLELDDTTVENSLDDTAEHPEDIEQEINSAE